MKRIYLQKCLFAVMSVFIIVMQFSPAQAGEESEMVHKSIVYGIPYGVDNPSQWHDTYDDRMFFYMFGSVKKHRDKVDADFGRIAKKYNTVIIFLPLADTAQYGENIAIMNALAKKHNLWLMFTILPDEEHYGKLSYITIGSERYQETVRAMSFLSSMSRVWKIALWYGWEKRIVPSDVVNFHASLSDELQSKYACWLDEEFILGMKKLRNSVGDAFLIVTEWYQNTNTSTIANMFKQQMLVTGYEKAKTYQEWRDMRFRHLDKIVMPDRLLGVWMYYDHGDGAEEMFSVYFPEENRLGDF